MRLWQTNPFHSVTITRGQGCTVWDTDGKPYLDLLSGTWCNVLGYGHPRWVEAVRSQVTKLIHVGAQFSTDEMLTALAKLKDVLPPALNRTVLLNTGSEAVELALKLARAATGADGVAVIERGYYGATAYALALSEVGRTASYLPSPGRVYRLPAPDCCNCPRDCSLPGTNRFPCLDPLAELAENRDTRLAAVIYEPVMGGGIIVPPIGYGKRLRALASRARALFIAEEVTTGMGRTGRWFGFEHDNIVPDILVVGKALGAGLPVAAVITTEAVEARCLTTSLRHVQSHQNDPLSGRVAAAVIEILQTEHLVELSATRGDYLLAGLRKLQASGPWLRDVRGRGTMLGIELQPEWSGCGTAITHRLLEAGFILDYYPSLSTLRLFPPFIITNREIDAFLQALRQVLLDLDGPQRPDG